MRSSAAPSTASPPFGPGEASVYDAAVGARLDARLAGQVLAVLPELEPVTMALDARCRAGRLARALLDRLPAGARLVGVDREEALLELARRRCFDDLGRRAFFKREHATALPFGDGVFDLVVAARAVEDAGGPHTALAELARVAAPGGTLVLAHRVAGAFAVVEDLLCEVAEALGRPEVARRAREVAARRPSLDEVAAWVEASGFRVVRADAPRVELRLAGARELAHDPVLRVEALPEWTFVAGPSDAAAVLRSLEEHLDVYLAGAPVELELPVGRIVATRDGTA